MRTISYRLGDLWKAVLEIGYVAENEHTRVQIDAGEVYAEYPHASVALTVQPPKGTPYPAVVTRDGNTVIWDIKDSDLIHMGKGEIQLTWSENDVIVKSCISRININRSIIGSGTAPDPLEDFLAEAGEALTAIPETIDAAFDAITAEAETLPAGSSATASFDGETKTLTIGVPKGDKGDTGDQGPAGQDGAPGKDGADGAPGKDGKDGADGADGHTPVKGTDYWTAEDKAEIVAAAAAEVAGDIIDDTAGEGDTNKVWSADKSAAVDSATKSALSSLQNMVADEESTTTATSAHAKNTVFRHDGKLLMALSAIAIGDTITTTGNTPNAVEVTIAEAFPHDVQINGTTILNNGVANIPIASDSAFGLAKYESWRGININANGFVYLNSATDGICKTGEDEYRPITAGHQKASVFYGLSKVAGVDLANETVTLGQYPNNSLVAIQKMLGIYEAPWGKIRDDTITNETAGSVEITVDNDGNSFELTDIRFIFWLPEQETEASLGSYGRIYCYYGDNNCQDIMFLGAWTQAANGTPRIAYGQILQKDKMVEITYQKNAIYSADQQIVGALRLPSDATTPGTFRLISSQRVYTKITIGSVKGTAKYVLYGKRKWN